jgi:predicted XRE-type DNA-binding protein
MVRRCHNPSHHAFKDYGARGITVCEKWRKFEGFFEDMGNQPSGLSIERIDNNLGYSKENCKWATVTEQARNRRATKLNDVKVVQIKVLLENGVSQSAIAEQFGVTRSAIGHIACGATWRT